jgi:hypothetical protein
MTHFAGTTEKRMNPGSRAERWSICVALAGRKAGTEPKRGSVPRIEGEQGLFLDGNARSRRIFASGSEPLAISTHFNVDFEIEIVLPFLKE